MLTNAGVLLHPSGDMKFLPCLMEGVNVPFCREGTIGPLHILLLAVASRQRKNDSMSTIFMEAKSRLY
jgi:hypothetical protein